MDKIPVLLAFGRHWDRTDGLITPPDRGFYRKAALPFIDREVLGAGRKATLIHECRIVVYPQGCDDKQAREYVREALAAEESAILAMLSDTVDRGLPLPGGLRDELDWGLLDRIMEINRSEPGRIRNAIEHQTPDQVYLALSRNHHDEGLDEDARRRERMKESIRTSIAVSKHRSREVMRLVGELLEEDPGHAILITRGYAHAGMARLFDPSRFAVESHAGGTLSPRISSDAIIASYDRDLSDTELGQYARQSIAFSDYFDSNWNGEPYRSLREGGAVIEGIQLLKKHAREHALAVA
ncbi:MAG: hypothetical protein AB1529_06940 [Candidatus Micrarchaeota archaeon]